MRNLNRLTQFRKDYKREAGGKHRSTLDADLMAVVQVLAADQPLGQRHRDHSFSGGYTGHRECHLKPDLLLIYEKPDDLTLRLVRLGSHSELF